MTRRSLVIAAVVLASFVASGMAVGDDFEDCGRAAVAEDWQAAVGPCSRLAEQGVAPAQDTVAWMHHHGLSVPQNDLKAVEWWTKAAEQGFALAHMRLGYLHWSGHGVPKDSRMAYYHINLAAALATEPEMRDSFTDLRDSAAKELTPQEIAEAQRMSSEWQEKFKAR